MRKFTRKIINRDDKYDYWVGDNGERNKYVIVPLNRATPAMWNWWTSPKRAFEAAGLKFNPEIFKQQ